MKRTCEWPVEIDEECGKPARFSVVSPGSDWKDDLMWLCAEHYDEFMVALAAWQRAADDGFPKVA